MLCYIKELKGRKFCQKLITTEEILDKICFHENLLEPQCLLQLQRDFLGLSQERTAGTLQLFKDTASKHLMGIWVIWV